MYIFTAVVALVSLPDYIQEHQDEKNSGNTLKREKEAL